MTKKKSSEIVTLKMEIFPEIGLRKYCLVPPPNSAPGLRPWIAWRNWRIETKSTLTNQMGRVLSLVDSTPFVLSVSIRAVSGAHLSSSGLEEAL